MNHTLTFFNNNKKPIALITFSSEDSNESVPYTLNILDKSYKKIEQILGWFATPMGSLFHSSEPDKRFATYNDWAVNQSNSSLLNILKQNGLKMELSKVPEDFMETLPYDPNHIY